MLGDQKVDEFGLKRQNKNRHSCLIARGMGVESSIRQNFYPQKLVRQLFGPPTFLAIRYYQ